MDATKSCSTNGVPDKRLSFADIVSKDSSSLNNVNTGSLSRYGDVICIKIDEQAYQCRVSICQNSLIGRLTQLKGEKPWKYDDLRIKLQRQTKRFNECYYYSTTCKTQ